jgi:hypothetical protein
MVSSTTNGNQAVKLDASGITYNPSTNLLSTGQLALTTALPIASGGTNNGSLGVTAGGVYYGDGSKLVVSAAGTANQVLKSGGSGAPSWTSNFSVSSSNVFVNTTTARNAGYLSVDYNGNSVGGAGVNDLDSANGSTYIGFLSGGTFRGSITNSNNTAVAYNTTSDYRLKENVVPMSSANALQRVLQLRPVTYTWISSKQPSEGFIAHEVQQTFPQAVTGQKDAVRPDGTPNYQGIDTHFLVAALVSAIQEQQKQIDALKQLVGG